MKIKEMLVLLGLFLVFGLRAQALDPSVEVTMYATVCPALFEAGETVWAPFATHTKGFLAGTVFELPTISPLGFHAITSASWRYVCVSSSSEFPLWLGEPTLGVQRGNAITCPFRITFSQPTLVSHLMISYETWDKEGKRSGTVSGLRITQFWDDTFGISSTGGTLTGYLTNTPLREVRSVGIRFTYLVDNQAGIEALLECPNFKQMAGLSCIVEVFHGETLLARGQIDLPFNPEPARLQVNGSSIRVDGATNQQYRLQSKSMLAPSSWQTIGLPIFSGSDVSMSDTANTASMFRVFQGELPSGTLNARLP